MAIMCRLLFALIASVLVEISIGQELNAEVVKTRLPDKMIRTASIYDGNDSIYIIGGYRPISGVTSEEILKFSITDETITQEASLPLQIQRGSAVLDNQGENIYYFGGIDGTYSSKADIYKFNLATKSTTLVG